MPLPGDLLRWDADEAVRLISLDLVSQAREAAPRCLDPEDAEGLHDFRVSIRRLRSTLSAWKELLRGAVTKHDRRWLAGLQKRTGRSRDAEVALVWLESRRAELGPEHLAGLEWLVDDLSTRASRPHPGGSAEPAGARLEFATRFCEWADDFESRIDSRAPYGDPQGDLQDDRRDDRRVPSCSSSYAEALAERVDAAAAGLSTRLAAANGNDRDRALHRIRIACKRLRYLVEPVRAESEVAVSLLERCKRLQDVLGMLNDANVLDDLLGACLDGVSTTNESGVLALRRLNAARAEASYRSFRVDWLAGAGMQTLLDEAAALARQELGAPASPPAF